MSAPGNGASGGAVLLDVRNLSAGYGELAVLNDINLSIRTGEIVAVVGSNAAGKTTLLRALSRVIDCSGSIVFAGQRIESLASDAAFDLGLVQVPEGRQLFDRMSVHDNLLMGAFRRRDRAGVTASMERVYTLFPVLKERRAQWAGSLSGGEQQMCAMARAMVAAPKLLMVDEMSLGLAPAIVDRLLDVLADIRKEGVTVLLVEQDVHSAFQVADRAYVMETGRIVREGPAAELADDPDVKRAYLGV
ncbi:MAG TPA: ABC transporter ATP-binding protein [Casimicrobiaceae bacterium]|nr:ABC transporter ATP-binding protein [Casimicrobiaceae bacterium]